MAVALLTVLSVGWTMGVAVAEGATLAPRVSLLYSLMHAIVTDRDGVMVRRDGCLV